MAISFDETLRGSLFQRLSKAAAILERARADFCVGGLYETDLKAFEAAVAGDNITVTGDRDREDDILEGQREEYDALKQAVAAYTAGVARRMRLLSMRNPWRDNSLYGTGVEGGSGVRGDTGGGPGSGGDFSGGGLPVFPAAGPGGASAYQATHQEIRRQMLAASETVQTCTPAVSAATAGSTNVGNGALVTSIKRGDGLTAELILADSGELRCVQSGYDKGGKRHREVFQFRSKSPVDGSHPDWGGSYFGAGANAMVRVIDPTQYGDPNGNLLTNGFESGWASATSNDPTGWESTTGTPGTDFQGTTGQAYFGSYSLEILGGTGVLTTLEQSFGSYNQLYSTKAKLEGSTQYAVCVRLKADAAPASGAAVVELVGTGNTLNEADDDQGTDNTFTIDLTTLTTSWQNFTGVFRTPRDVADGTKIRLRLTTALAASREAFVDGFAMGKMTELYRGGPWVALFAGSTPFTSGTENLQRDYFTITTTNDSGGAAQPRRNFHRLADAVFGLRDNGVLYPSTTSETIADAVL